MLSLWPVSTLQEDTKVPCLCSHVGQLWPDSHTELPGDLSGLLNLLFLAWFFPLPLAGLTSFPFLSDCGKLQPISGFAPVIPTRDKQSNQQPSSQWNTDYGKKSRGHQCRSAEKQRLLITPGKTKLKQTGLGPCGQPPVAGTESSNT